MTLKLDRTDAAYNDGDCRSKCAGVVACWPLVRAQPSSLYKTAGRSSAWASEALCLDMEAARQVGLLDRLARIVPEGLGSFFFASSGSEVVDNAVKLARAHTGRPNIIAFEVGRHLRIATSPARMAADCQFGQIVLRGSLWVPHRCRFWHRHIGCVIVHPRHSASSLTEAMGCHCLEVRLSRRSPVSAPDGAVCYCL